MGTCYTLWINNEFNWNYILGEKGKLKKDIKEAIPHCELIADFDGWLIIDIGKTAPFDSRFDFIVCDHILVSDDNGNSIPKLLRKGG